MIQSWQDMKITPHPVVFAGRKLICFRIHFSHSGSVFGWCPEYTVILQVLGDYSTVWPEKQESAGVRSLCFSHAPNEILPSAPLKVSTAQTTHATIIIVRELVHPFSYYYPHFSPLSSLSPFLFRFCTSTVHCPKFPIVKSLTD